MTRHSRAWLTAVALAASAATTAPAAAQSLQYLGQPANTGGGLGNVATILTLLHPGGSSTESGCVGLTGFTGCGFTDSSVQNGQSQLQSISQFPSLTGSSFRLFFNAAEPGNDNTVTLNQLVVTLYGSGSNSFTATLPGVPLTLTDALNGIGNYGYLFGLSPNDFSAFDAFIAANPAAMVGVGAEISNAQGGPETFSLGMTAQTVVPEPSTYLLMASGLAGLGLLARRRRA